MAGSVGIPIARAAATILILGLVMKNEYDHCQFVSDPPTTSFSLFLHLQ